MTLAKRVFYDVGTQRVTAGPSLVIPVCDICGAVLADQERHDEWHEASEEEE